MIYARTATKFCTADSWRVWVRHDMPMSLLRCGEVLDTLPHLIDRSVDATLFGQHDSIWEITPIVRIEYKEFPGRTCRALQVSPDGITTEIV